MERRLIEFWEAESFLERIIQAAVEVAACRYGDYTSEAGVRLINPVLDFLFEGSIVSHGKVSRDRKVV